MPDDKASLLIAAICLALGCALFGPKQIPAFTGLGVQQVSGPGAGAVAATELSCRVDQRDYPIEDLTMLLQFHECNRDPVETRDGATYLIDPTIINESLRPDAEFAPTEHNFVHAFRIGAGGVDPNSCVTFRCRAKYRDGAEGITLDSRFCRGNVMQQRICSGGGMRKTK